MLDIDEQIKYIELCAERDAIADGMRRIYHDVYLMHGNVSPSFERRLETLRSGLKKTLEELRKMDEVHYKTINYATGIESFLEMEETNNE